MPLLRVMLRRYPALVDLLADRHVRYNKSLADLAELERAGRVFVIRPSASVRMPMIVRDPEVLDRAYRFGREDAERSLDALRSYLG